MKFNKIHIETIHHIFEYCFALVAFVAHLNLVSANSAKSAKCSSLNSLLIFAPAYINS